MNDDHTNVRRNHDGPYILPILPIPIPKSLFLPGKETHRLEVCTEAVLLRQASRWRFHADGAFPMRRESACHTPAENSIRLNASLSNGEIYGARELWRKEMRILLSRQPQRKQKRGEKKGDFADDIPV